MKTYKVLIDGKEQVLKFTYSNGNSWQYNLEDDSCAHTFSKPIEMFPKNKDIKTNGHTYKIL